MNLRLYLLYEVDVVHHSLQLLFWVLLVNAGQTQG